MRVVFGVLSLLVVVAIVGFLAKKQLGRASAPVAVPPAEGVPSVASGGTPAQQSQQLQQQVKKDVESLMQQARPMPEDTSP
jgi:multidrug efflux pump subunit AcrB